MDMVDEDVSPRKQMSLVSGVVGLWLITFFADMSRSPLSQSSLPSSMDSLLNRPPCSLTTISTSPNGLLQGRTRIVTRPRHSIQVVL